MAPSVEKTFGENQMNWEDFEKIVDDSIMHLYNSEWDALRENFEAWKAQKESSEVGE